jgi:hypothetical protein
MAGQKEVKINIPLQIDGGILPQSVREQQMKQQRPISHNRTDERV